MRQQLVLVLTLSALISICAAQQPTPEPREDTTGSLEFVTSADGTQIAVERIGDGPPLVLVHGIGLDRTFWDTSGITDSLARHYTVYALDRRGRGESADASSHRLQSEALDVVAVADAIGGAVTVLGHSYGALCALGAAAHTESIDEVILYEPPFSPSGGYPVLEEALVRLQPLLDEQRYEEALAFIWGAVGLSEEQIASFLAGLSSDAITQIARALPRELRAIIEYELDTVGLAAMRTEALLLLGANSSERLAGATEALHDVLPNSDIAIIAGTGHFAMLDTLDGFLAEIMDREDAAQRGSP